MGTKSKTIIVGMSGGVDSSVTALILKEQGFDVQGVFMKNWESEDDDPNCFMDQDLSDARAICKILSIPLHILNFAPTYWRKVFQHFLDEYSAGRTPNPDILCNKEIKFKAFLEYALEQGADAIATGHYALIKENKEFELWKGIDPNKDQSYFLYTLGQFQLAQSLFPLGNYTKKEIRAIANKAGFPNHEKKDSTGICFIGERHFKNFLSEYLLAKPGRIETDEGKNIGEHGGLMFYTLGQRRGLNIGGRKEAKEAPWYVLDKDIKRNVLIVGQDSYHPLLMKTELKCHQLHWVSNKSLIKPFNCSAKIRYRQTDQQCKIEPITNDECKVIFNKPQRAITPGQSVVFYDNEICLGGGIIC